MQGGETMRRKIMRSILQPAVLLFCFALASCGIPALSGNPDEEADVPCMIGVISDGDAYTAAIELEEETWEALTEKQKENIVDQCVETVELSREEDDDADYELTGICKQTKETLFTYSGSEQKTAFAEAAEDAEDAKAAEAAEDTEERK